ncbi:MAG: CoA-binding protein, partial [Bacteroidetes bacterium]|nr:CoA-binding protein [Bacteroidota bacterium]
TELEIEQMTGRLKGYKLLTGTRGQKGIDLPAFYRAVSAVSALVLVAPEIIEMDLNPLLGTPDDLIAVDARIRLK